MEITEVKIFPVNEDKLKAYVTVTLDNCFIVRDLKVINGNKGLFVAMPSKKRRDGTFRDIAHPLNSGCRDYMEGKILEAYRKDVLEAGKSDAEETEASESQAQDESAEVVSDSSSSSETPE